MRRSAFIGCITTILTLVAWNSSLFQFSATAQTATTGAPGTLTVMTYNLRYASSAPPNAWPQRRPLMAELIEKVVPDVFGTQEGLYGQHQDLAADLPGYQ
jgi:endonuclease/exonuclease/phosphatase family metal-dependent hydrolase